MYLGIKKYYFYKSISIISCISYIFYNISIEQVLPKIVGTQMMQVVGPGSPVWGIVKSILCLQNPLVKGTAQSVSAPVKVSLTGSSDLLSQAKSKE